MPTHVSIKSRREPAALRRGDMLHKYRIEKVLGSGAFSNVYRAYDTVEGVRVALKLFTRRVSTDNQQAFRNEVRIISRLDHKNILRLKTAEVVDGHFLTVSELGEQTLWDQFQRSRPVKYSLQVLDQILEGLAYAHDNGVIHRDIKPENILVWRDGRVKLADFGVSKLMDRPHTHTTVTGTPSYRAPEQAYGRPTFASDVFALALVFYEMVTRTLPRWPLQWPFDRHEIFESRVPGGLVRVIRRAANFDLDKRYRNAGAMLRAVHAAVPELANGQTRAVLTPPATKHLPWREYRQREFEKRHAKHLELEFRCHRCAGPVSEYMSACPWCGYKSNSFDGITRFPSVCVRCEHGVHDDWAYCAWCYGAGFPSVSHVPSEDPRYSGRCTRCGETRLLPHMRFCPWCNSRLRAWRSRQLHERCAACRNSVAADYWDFCAWCGKDLVLQRSRNGRKRTG